MHRIGVGMNRAVFLLIVSGVLIGPSVFATTATADEALYEVWIVDQSNTAVSGATSYGGTLYIYQGDELSGKDAAAAGTQVIDLAGAASSLCLALTGSLPVRPHMLVFNAMRTHAILSFVATGHVLFLDAATRTPVACIDVGLQAPAAFPSPDQAYVIVANQNGKLVQRISTDYASNTYSLDAAATIDLATGTTPNGVLRQDAALRPDNAPICPVIDSTSRFAFVTLRGGGLFVVDSTATPMAIVAEYDQATVHPSGCGGVETAGKMDINSGGGWP